MFVVIEKNNKLCALDKDGNHKISVWNENVLCAIVREAVKLRGWNDSLQ